MAAQRPKPQKPGKPGKPERKPGKPERLLNPLPRKVLRERIGNTEVAFGAAFVGLVGGATVWVAAQGNQFDPAERDLSSEALAASSVEDTLYRAPLVRWREPGTEPAAGTAQPLDLGLFPAGLLDGGWQLDGRVESFTPENVYEKINGAAELYLRYGFQALHYVSLAKDQIFLSIELYDQGTPQNALGVFSEQRDPDQAVQQRGPLELYTTTAGCIGRYDRFYFKIAASAENPDLVAKSLQIAELIATLPASVVQEPLPQRVLGTRLGLPSEQLEYVKTDAFQYDFAQEFWFGRLAPEAEARVFLHEALDEAAAKTLVQRLIEEQKNEYSVLEEKPDRAVLEHEYLKTVFAIRQQGPIVLGIEGAATATEADAALGRLQEGLSLESRQADPAP